MVASKYLLVLIICWALPPQGSSWNIFSRGVSRVPNAKDKYCIALLKESFWTKWMPGRSYCMKRLESRGLTQYVPSRCHGGSCSGDSDLVSRLMGSKNSIGRGYDPAGYGDGIENWIPKETDAIAPASSAEMQPQPLPLDFSPWNPNYLPTHTVGPVPAISHSSPTKPPPVKIYPWILSYTPIQVAVPSLISQTKCKEYRTKLEEPMVLRVSGGRQAGRMFPHMVQLRYREKNRSGDDVAKCGGSLISDRFVLTAAHCLDYNNTYDLTRVLVGSDDEQIDVQVQGYYMHPDYAGNKKHDIALLKLAQIVSFTNYRRPACLHASGDLPADVQFTVCGWGRTSEYDMVGSRALVQASLPIVKDSICQRAFADFNPQWMICAGDTVNRINTCQGDSGSPLQVEVTREPSSLYQIVAVTSFGSGVCSKQFSVFTKVSPYLNWIEPIVWP